MRIDENSLPLLVSQENHQTQSKADCAMIYVGIWIIGLLLAASASTDFDRKTLVNIFLGSFVSYTVYKRAVKRF